MSRSAMCTWLCSDQWREDNSRVCGEQQYTISLCSYAQLFMIPLPEWGIEHHLCKLWKLRTVCMTTLPDYSSKDEQDKAWNHQATTALIRATVSASSSNDAILWTEHDHSPHVTLVWKHSVACHCPLATCNMQLWCESGIREVGRKAPKENNGKTFNSHQRSHKETIQNRNEKQCQTKWK